MTVAEAIKMLNKIPDKSLQIFVDCPRCDQANIIRKVDTVVVLECEREKEMRDE